MQSGEVSKRYDYSQAGFGSFLTRSLDDAGQASLDTGNVQSRAVAYDRAQVSGAIGDTFRVGGLLLSGTEGIALTGSERELLRLGSLQYGPGLSVNDENNLRFLAGASQGGDIKIKLSKQGFDADTATDDQLIWSSDFNNIKIVKTGTTSVSSNGSPTNWTTIVHNLGFTPSVMAFLNNVNLSGITTGGNIPLPTFSSATINTVSGQVEFGTWMLAVPDATNLYIILYNATSAPISPLSVKYYLFQETAN